MEGLDPLVDRLRAGDRTSVEPLILMLQPLAKSIALGFRVPPVLREELVAEAWYILTRSVNKCLGPNSLLTDNNLHHYVAFTIKRKLLFYLVENTSVRVPESTQRKGVRPPTRISTNLTTKAALNREDMEVILAVGTPKQARIVFRRLMGFTSEEIAKEFGHPKSYITAELNKFRKKYSDFLGTLCN